MSRNLSTNILEVLAAQETGRVIIMLVTIDHTSLGSPIRVTSDSVNTVSNSNTFVAYPFQLTIPNDPEEGISAGKLVIDNVNKTIITAIRQIATPPTVTIELVMDDDPDVVYVSFDGFELRNITYDALTISADLVMDHFMHEPFPGNRFIPSHFPGLF